MAASRSSPFPLLVKGCHDLLPERAWRYSRVEAALVRQAKRAGCREVRTPVIEPQSLYSRSLHDSDVVHKELFAFVDRPHRPGLGGEKRSRPAEEDEGREAVCLRPEGTASVVRALGGQLDSGSRRVFYNGPMFRRERPQRGRSRQFQQFGVEFLGALEEGGSRGDRKSTSKDVVASVLSDIECIDLAYRSLDQLGIASHCPLYLNSLGDIPSRARYSQALDLWFSPRKNLFSEESIARYDRGNMLRILDTKNATDQALITGTANKQLKDQLAKLYRENPLTATSIEAFVEMKAPLLSDFYSDAAQERFVALQQALHALHIPFELDPYLVRGLDYYDHAAFEFKTLLLQSKSNLKTNEAPRSSDTAVSMVSSDYGSQSTVLAGGRYDSLFQSLGGMRSLPAVGWAAGVDRLVLLMEEIESTFFSQSPPPSTVAVIAVLGDKTKNCASAVNSPVLLAALALISQLRNQGFHVFHWLEKDKASKQLSAASKHGCFACLIVGEDELSRSVVKIKNMHTSDQIEVTRGALCGYLETLVSRGHSSLFTVVVGFLTTHAFFAVLIDKIRWLQRRYDGKSKWN